MTKKDKQSLAGIASKKEIVELFNQGMTEIILPVLDEMNKKMATKDDIKDIEAQLDSIERKVEAQQLRSDRHGKDIESLKKISAFA